MIIHEAKIIVENSRCRLSAVVEIETSGVFFKGTHTSRQQLWIDWPEEYFRPTQLDGAPFILICLSLAMCLNERLVSKNPINRSLLPNILEAMEIYRHYFPALCNVIHVEVSTFKTQQSAASRIGSFLFRWGGLTLQYRGTPTATARIWNPDSERSLANSGDGY